MVQIRTMGIFKDNWKLRKIGKKIYRPKSRSRPNKEYDELYRNLNQEEYVRTLKMSLTFCILNIIFLIFQKNITLNLKNDKLTEDLKVTKDREERVISEAKDFAVKSSKTKEELFAKLSEAYQVKWFLISNKFGHN